MNILLVNDDGINAKGLKLLAQALQGCGTLFVVAPTEQKSAVSHSITIKDAMEIKEDSFHLSQNVYSVDGTPADCVRVGLKFFINEGIDLVVSGINDGYNYGTDIIYSGTVSGAKEAYINGVPGIAVSALAGLANEKLIVDQTSLVLQEIIDKQLYVDSILNINLPKDKSKGIRITKMGKRYWFADFVQIRGKDDSYNLIYSQTVYEEDEDSDCKAIDDGYVSITPLQIDQTDRKKLNSLKKEYKI
jgi:5'-nucleotidase